MEHNKIKACQRTYFLFAALCTIKTFFSDSKSGLSFATTIDCNWSSRPLGVIIKFSRVTLTAISGR